MSETVTDICLKQVALQQHMREIYYIIQRQKKELLKNSSSHLIQQLATLSALVARNFQSLPILFCMLLGPCTPHKSELGGIASL